MVVCDATDGVSYIGIITSHTEDLVSVFWYGLNIHVTLPKYNANQYFEVI